MKKISILVLVCMLMGGCAAKVSPAEIYKMVNDAQEAIHQSEGMNAEIEMGIKMKIQEETQEMMINGELIIEDTKSEDMKFKMEMALEMDGQNMSIVQYYKEGYLYIDMMGMKAKQPMPYADALTQANSLNFSEGGFGEEMYENAKLSKNGEDSVVVLNVDGELMKELSAKMLEQFSMPGIDSVNVEYGKVSIRTVINKDGLLSEESVVLPMKMTVQEEVIELDMTMTMRYLNVGQPVVIEFPDFSDYTE